MSGKKACRLEFYGSCKMAILPILLYIFLSAFFAVFYQYYSMRALVFSAFIGLLVGFLFVKNKAKYWDAVISGLSQFGNAKLIFTFLLIGVFTKMLTFGKIGNGFVWLSTQMHISGSLFVVFAFLASSIISLGAGAPIAAMFAVVPIFYPPGILLGSEPAVLLGALLSGVFFGDALSPSSQVINTTIDTQKDGETQETADLQTVLKERTPWLLLIAVIAMVLFYLFGGAETGQMANHLALLADFSDSSGLWMLVPVIVLLVVSFKTKNLFLGLPIGILTGLVVGLVTGIFSWQDIVLVNAEATQISGIIFDGIYSMVDIVISTILLFGMISVAVEGGVLTLFCDWVLSKRIFCSTKGAELVLVLGTGIVNIFLSGCVLPAILLFGHIADTIGQRSGIPPGKRVYLMTGIATSVTAIIPVNSAFVMGAITLINEMPDILPQSVVPSPFAIFSSSYYCILLTVVCFIWIFAERGKKKLPLAQNA